MSSPADNKEIRQMYFQYQSVKSKNKHIVETFTP
jgi:hypothetical protein